MDLTVSSPVDTFLQASTQEQMRAALGFSDPGVAWFTSDGNTSTGDGSPGNPYGPGNGQKALRAGYQVLRIGKGCDIGSVGWEVTMSFGPPLDLTIIGSGQDSVVGIGVVEGYTNTIYLDNCRASIITCRQGSSSPVGTLALYISPTASCDSIDFSGVDGADDGMGTPVDGGNGGIVRIYGQGLVTAVNVNPGNGVNGGGTGTAGSVSGAGFNINGTFYAATYP